MIDSFFYFFFCLNELTKQTISICFHDLINWVNKLTLKDKIISYFFTLFTCGGPCDLSSFNQCSLTCHDSDCFCHFLFYFEVCSVVALFPPILCLHLFQPIAVSSVYFPHLCCSTSLHFYLVPLLVVCVYSLCAPSCLCQFVPVLPTCVPHLSLFPRACCLQCLQVSPCGMFLVLCFLPALPPVFPDVNLCFVFNKARSQLLILPASLVFLHLDPLLFTIYYFLGFLAFMVLLIEQLEDMTGNRMKERGVTRSNGLHSNPRPVQRGQSLCT